MVRLTMPRQLCSLLAIETSCDDTCVALMDLQGKILAERRFFQTPIHNRFGGINPPLAARLHSEHLSKLIDETLNEGGVNRVQYVAVTNRPGLLTCLQVGVQHALDLARKHKASLIPVHHMRAHALTAMYAREPETSPKPKYPFLCVLASGGHCILARVCGASEFYILGQTLDTAPGDAIDKIYRRLRLQHVNSLKDNNGKPIDLKNVSGGRALELVARGGDPLAYFSNLNFMSKHCNCDFSFSGLRHTTEMQIAKIEQEQQRFTTEIDGLSDLCASVLHALLRMVGARVHRAIEICDQLGWMPPTNRHLVISGGVASNSYLRRGLSHFIAPFDYSLIAPPPLVCADNAAMIGWNALQILQDPESGSDIFSPENVPKNVHEIHLAMREPIGVDISTAIDDMQWKIQQPVSINKIAQHICM